MRRWPSISRTTSWSIEGPQSEERADAIIAEAKKDIPNKPIKYVVNTHNHFDHSSGLRTFIAEGATIITHQDNKAYYEKIFSLPHTLNPDRQSEAKKKISIETMTDKKVLTDGNHVIELYRLQGSNHNDGLIVAYLPKEKILVEADAFNPPAQANAPPPSRHQCQQHESCGEHRPAETRCRDDRSHPLPARWPQGHHARS